MRYILWKEKRKQVFSCIIRSKNGAFEYLTMKLKYLKQYYCIELN